MFQDEGGGYGQRETLLESSGDADRASVTRARLINSSLPSPTPAAVLLG